MMIMIIIIIIIIIIIKYQPSKTAKLLGGENETIRYMGLRFSQITEIVILFRYSESLFYSSIREERAYANKAQNVNKYSHVK